MHYQSGNTFYKDKINKRGKKSYDKLKTQPQGKPHKVASIACVNKFLKVAFHLITHNITYDYEADKTVRK